MFKGKTLFLIIGLTILIVMLVILQFTVDIPDQQSQSTTTPQPHPTAGLSDLFEVTRNTLNNEVINITDSYFLTFSLPVNQATAKVSINPDTPINLSWDNSGTLLTITPTPTWDFETKYQVTIKKETINIAGKSLKNDVILNFETYTYGDAGGH